MRTFRSAAGFGLGSGYGLDTDGSAVLLRDQPGGDVAGTRYRIHDFYVNGMPMLVHVVPASVPAVPFQTSVPDMRPLFAVMATILAAPAVTWAVVTLFAF